MKLFLTILRSLIIFSFFVAPLIGYLLIARRRKPLFSAPLAPLPVLIIALISGLAALGVIHFSGHWPEATQAVWTGAETEARQFVIGGARESALIGWPNGSFTPSLRALPFTGSVVTLEVGGGGAFVLEDETGKFHGGETLEPDGERPMGGYRLRLTRGLRASLNNPRPAVVEIYTAKGEPAARFDLPAADARRHRVLSLRRFIDAGGVADAREAERLVNLGRWAADKRLLVTRAGEARVLAADASYRVPCTLPCRLTLYWAGQRLPVLVRGNTSRLGIMFPPPWRVSSPLPPLAQNGERRLTLTATPRPDDLAFVLPLGHAVYDRRPSLTFGEDSSGRPIFTGSGVVDCKPPPPEYLPVGTPPPRDPNEFASSQTSCVQVGFDQLLLHFSTVNDLPSPKGIALLMLVAFLAYVVGVMLIGARSPDAATRITVLGLGACLWNLLAFRVLLSLRFAIDPSRLDDLTVKGVTLSLAGLAFIPGIVLLWARLRADLNARLASIAAGGMSAREAEADRRNRRRTWKLTLGYLIALAAAFLIEFIGAPRLWKNPPSPPSFKLAFPFLLVVFYLFCVASCVYLSYVPSLRRALRLLFITPLRFDVALARRGKALWLQYALEPRAKPVSALWWALACVIAISSLLIAMWLQPASGFWSKLWTLAALFALGCSLLWIFVRLARRAAGRLFAASVIFALLPMAARAFPTVMREIGQEVITLFALCLVPVLFWLSLTLVRSQARNKLPWRRIAFLAVTMVVLPVFVMPKFLGDMGSAFAAIPLFAAAAALLVLTPAWRAGAVVACAVTFGMLLAVFTYTYFSSWLPGAAEVRLISYWQGSEIERLIPWARATRSGGGISLQSLRDAYQHGWESRAIAYEGGWWGVGYGSAPAHLSQVRQDTIQFDSLFSFFVAGEHGIIGGLSLLLLFILPLALVWRAARSTRLDYGYAAALLVCAWLFLEAVLHAGMNLGTFPFTGRGMPVINVNSTSDLLRWLVLFAFAAQLLHWRDPDGDSTRTSQDTSTILAEPRPGRSAPAANAPASASAAAATATPLRSRRVMAVGLLVALPLVAVAFTHARLITDDHFPRTFEWSGVLDRIRGMIRDQVLTADAEGRIVPDYGKLPEDFSVPDGALLQQEILRFNALSREERLDELSTIAYRERLRKLASVADYDRLIEDLRTESINRPRDARPGLFRLLPPERQTDGVTVHEVGGYRLTINSAFNSQLSFRAGAEREGVARVTLADGQVLVGPAWVSGRWIAASAPEPSIPWAWQLARALNVGQNCFGRGRVRPCEAALTLEPALHEAATKFVSERGREIFNEAMKPEAGGDAPPTRVPPRVALAVVNIANGATLALGGYPRMTSSPYWQRANGTNEWLPPARWVEQQAPDALRTLYGGDRNFDRLIVGSATKPMLAAAALAVHPRLADQLRVRGSDDSEFAVFGIPLSDGSRSEDRWHVTPRPNWIDFTQYLSLSDNRYHVRLGFLGLAEEAGGDVRGVGQSPSELESLSGGNSPWRRYPQFSAESQFSQSNRTTIANLERSQLASHLERMFALNPGGKQLGSRVSFWTKDEADDITPDPRQPTAVDVVDESSSPAGFTPISPVAPNLRLDSVTRPRDFVSLLLGGRTNLWANVDLASAFVTTLTGRPFAAHVVRDDRPFRYSPDRESFEQAAARMRPGLTATVRTGTYAAALKSPAGAQHMAALDRLARGYSIYAKTGTLQMTAREASGRPRYMSRVILAIVRWEDSSQKKVRSGLVFSFMAEMTDEGNASRWLARFIANNENALQQALSK